MGKVFFAIVAVLASLALVESLSCNQCSFGVLGFCLGKQNVSCTNGNSSVCFSGTVSFPSVSSFGGFNSQGCRDNNTGCVTTTGSLLGVSYNTQITCCSTNNCNPYTISSASTTKMTFTGAVGAAILACVLGGMMK